jgi:sialate O-acetylesterase
MRIARYPFLRAACLLLFTAYLALPAVTLPALFSDHMVLQRGMPVHVWGTAEPGENVTAAFRDETRHATADNLGL